MAQRRLEWSQEFEFAFDNFASLGREAAVGFRGERVFDFGIDEMALATETAHSEAGEGVKHTENVERVLPDGSTEAFGKIGRAHV